MKKFAVIGNPVAHSRSPEIHAFFARQAGIDMSYERIESPLDAFVKTANQFLDGGGDGFNVTVPFKREAFDFCDVLSDRARESLAVNTVSVANGRRAGDNTDGAGLTQDLEVNLGWKVKGSKVLVIGAGGAASGVLPALLAREPERLHVVNRTHSKAEALAERYTGVLAIEIGSLAAEGPYELIISASSAGLSGAPVVLPASIIDINTKCYDMIYGKDLTAFNRWASDAGSLAVSDGLGMLVEQAALAFETWLGFEPDTGPVINAVRELVNRS